MIPIGLGVAFLGYTAGLWGYCLVRGYDVPFSALFKTTWPATGSSTAPGSQLPPADPGVGTANV